MSVRFSQRVRGHIYLYEAVPKGFIPDQDNDQMYVNTEAAQGTSYEEMVALTQRVAEIMRPGSQRGSVPSPAWAAARAARGPVHRTRGEFMFS